MTGHVLKLRKSMGDEARTVADSLRACRQPAAPLPPGMQVFDQARTRDLLAVLNHVLAAGRALIEFIDSDRNLARTAGVETIGIEVASILGGDRIGRLVDTIEESLSRNEPVSLSQEGLAELRRLERLLAEASNNIDRFTNAGYRLAESARMHAARESDRIRLEIKHQEQRLNSIKQQYAIHGIAAKQEQERLSDIDHINDSDLLGATNPQATRPGVEWGALLGVGAVTIVAILVVVLIGKK